MQYVAIFPPNIVQFQEYHWSRNNSRIFLKRNIPYFTFEVWKCGGTAGYVFRRASLIRSGKNAFELIISNSSLSLMPLDNLFVIGTKEKPVFIMLQKIRPRGVFVLGNTVLLEKLVRLLFFFRLSIIKRWCVKSTVTISWTEPIWLKSGIICQRPLYSRF